MKLHFYSLLALGCFSFNQLTFAQTLNQAIDNQISQTEKRLNDDSESNFHANYPGDLPYHYRLIEKKIIKQDLDGDKIRDAVVSFYYCEKTNCHPTTQTFDVAVFQGLGANQYKLVENKTLGVTGNVKLDKKNIIIKSFNYKDTDASCCASIQKIEKFKLVNSNLKKIK